MNRKKKGKDINRKQTDKQADRHIDSYKDRKTRRRQTDRHGLPGRKPKEKK